MVLRSGCRMMMHVRRAAAAVAAAALLAAGSAMAQGEWPSFRGPRAAGIAPGPAPPLTWDLESGTNVLWRTEIPGLAHSSPVIWGDRIYLTTAVGEEGDGELKVGLYGDVAAADDDGVHSYWVYALDRASGDVVWKRKAYEGKPAIRRHTKASHANATPATDGEHVVAFFGSEGLYCYDREGNLRWKKSFGVLDAGWYFMPTAQWGFGNSPVIHDGKVIVLADVQKGGFLALFDVRDGRPLWRVARDDVPTWTTPTVVEVGGRPQIVVNGYRHIGGYDFASGEVRWKMKGGGDIPVPAPVAGHGLVFITNAHGRQSPIYAVRQSAEGDVTLADGATASEHVAWAVLRGGAYMQTPILLGDELYVCRDNGALSCYDAKTGERHYQERLSRSGRGFTASAVAAGGRIYYASETGDVFVVQAGKSFKLLAQNALGEITMATPAIAGGVLYARTRHHLIAIGEKPAAPTPPPADAQGSDP